MADSSPIAQALTQPGEKPKMVSQIYPVPFIVSPISPHKQTMLLLHGRGSNGETFGREFLASKTTIGKSIQEHFPDMKFVFPTAKRRRAKWYNRAFITQWFDSVPINEQSGRRMSKEEVDWQLEGLAETAEFLRPILDNEVVAVGAKNVFIGGLSQGCAMAAHLLLSYQPGESEGDENDSLGGFIGMSGWLPFADEVQDLIRPDELVGKEDNDDPFATSTQLSPAIQVCNFVRDIMDLPLLKEMEPSCLRTPVFLGHGKSDEKVKIDLGLEVAIVLRQIGIGVRWEEYDEGHWYKVPEEIDDIVDFLVPSAESL
ncbi:alpha hydrolase-9 [Coleophoma cylindrospora]|uniref:Acyl-protein thioesterase 1 n=1 Tax=Coleophoma cylindrospora TaxID=1849047 RepID=A0A3D8RBV0_9HELO|nr:alpha hydrolase-9 [Coleophoma cylindrospora]